MLIQISDPDKREYYEFEAANNAWTGRELERQINSQLYERLLLSNDKESVLAVARKERIPETPQEVIKDPMVLEFLGLERKPVYYESDLESEILSHITEFLLDCPKTIKQSSQANINCTCRRRSNLSTKSTKPRNLRKEKTKSLITKSAQRHFYEIESRAGCFYKFCNYICKFPKIVIFTVENGRTEKRALLSFLYDLRGFASVLQIWHDFCIHGTENKT